MAKTKVKGGFRVTDGPGKTTVLDTRGNVVQIGTQGQSPVHELNCSTIAGAGFVKNLNDGPVTSHATARWIQIKINGVVCYMPYWSST